MSDILPAIPDLPIPIMSVKALSALLEQDTYTMTLMADGTGVLLDLHNESLLTFNDTGAFMFNLIKKGDSEEAIVAQVVTTYQVDEATARTDVDAFIGQLKKALGSKADSK